VLVLELLEKVGQLIVVFETHSYVVFVVFKARWHNQLVAVKRLTLPGNHSTPLNHIVFTSQLDDNEENAKEREQIGENFKRECDLMRKLPPHRHVLQVVGICK
jgi:hypothetical protein